MDEEQWRQMAGPWARARMPDGQELDVIVTGRQRAPDGSWWYTAEAILPDRRVEADGSVRPVGAPTPIVLPSDRVTPIPGEDYAAVPTEGAVAGRQWRVERLREYGSGPWRRVHRRDCWQARAGAESVTAASARELLRRGEALPCDVCRPERGLA
ncbi:DUF6233 domain-containing protein [Streptomyces buecherae]|uniref:DUF6233 domain-containing protein n=1 Tax=Streptomyces buecherae TaxID=2763006 RepID=UPI0033C260A3